MMSTSRLTTQNNSCAINYENMNPALVIPSVIQVAINLFVILVILCNRKLLRHNFVYLYVINLLAANAILGIVSGYHILVYHTNLEKISGHSNLNKTYSDHRELKGWWTFRISVSMSLFLTMSGSISLLIYGIRESSYFVGKSMVSSSPKIKKTSSKKLYVLVMVIVLLWTLPLFLAAASTAGWSCAINCFCSYGSYFVFSCHEDELLYCSRWFKPLRNDFLLVVVILWLFLLIGIIYMMATTMKRFIKVTGGNSTDRNLKSQEHKVSGKHEQNVSNNTDSVEHSTNPSIKRKASNKRKFILNGNIKLLLLLSTLFFICISPSILMVIIDAAYDRKVLPDVFSWLAAILLFMYCSISPILLVYKMGGLRKIFRGLLFQWNCCYTTIVKSGNASITKRG